MSRNQVINRGGEIPIDAAWGQGAGTKWAPSDVLTEKKLQDELGLTDKALKDTVKRYRYNPESPEFKDLPISQRVILAKASGVPFNAEHAQQIQEIEAEKRYRTGLVQVGIDTSEPEYISRDDAERIKKQSPNLYDLLEHKGLKAYNITIGRLGEDYENQREENAKQIESNKKSFEAEINKPDFPAEIREAYRKGGIDAYNQAVDEYNARTEESRTKHVVIDGQAMTIANWSELPGEYQHIALKDGWDAMFTKMDADYKSNQAITERENKALDILKPYTNTDGTVDIFSFLNDIQNAKEGRAREVTFKTPAEKLSYLKEHGEPPAAKVPEYDGEQVLKDAGFKEEDIKSASYEAKLNPEQRFWQGMTPWNEAKGETVTPKGALTMGAEMLVPGVYSARHWKDISAGEKVIAVVIDAVSLFPVARAAGVEARAVAGTATRAGVMAAATRGALRETAAVLAGPVEVILHPIGTVKATVSDVRNLAEDIAHPKKIPAMSVYTSENTVRLAIKGDITEAKALAIRDQLMDAVSHGERAFIKIGNQTIELRRSPLMTELKGGMAHATPQGNFFEEVLKVAEKPGLPLKEQGLFLSPDPLPRFSTTSAFGKPGEQPTIFIMSPETAAKTVNTGKIYDSPVGKVAEMERKLPVSAETKGTGQKLFTRIGPFGTRVEIWLEEGTKLSKIQIAKLKAQGLIEWVKAPFEPALKIKGEGEILGLSHGETEQLSSILRKSGATREASELLRAERLLQSARAYAPQLLRVGRGISNAEVRREIEDMQRTQTRRVLPTSRAASRAVRAEVDRLRRELTRTKTTRTAARRETPSREQPRIERTFERVTPRYTREPSMRAERATERARVERTTRTERGERTSRAERINRTERGGRVERVTRAERGETIGRVRQVTGRRGIGRITRFTGREHGGRGYLQLGTDQEKRQAILEAGGAVAWRQGQVGGKDRWDVIINPYQDNSDYVMLLGRPPEGAVTFARGPKSAYKTAQQFRTGKPPTRKVLVDSGAMDIGLIPEGPHGVSLKFAPDPKGLTKGDITIGERSPRISQGFVPISRRARMPWRNIRITPRTPRLR
jgi:hypothetical protein